MGKGVAAGEFNWTDKALHKLVQMVGMRRGRCEKLVRQGSRMLAYARFWTKNLSQRRSAIVAFTCEICSKRHQSGHNVSHANNKTKRTFNPNLQTVKALINGSPKRIKVCTRCLRSGFVQKAV